MITIRALLGRIKRRLTNQFPRRLPGFAKIRNQIVNKRGFEIGGPSAIFARDGQIPVYAFADVIDNCNFSSNTVWEGDISPDSGFKFHIHKNSGKQYIAEAGSLAMIADLSYDFVISSHCIEHLANPIGSLIEWKRLIKPNGLLILVVPDSEKTFDHRREVTSIDHLISDYENDIDENDMTHIDEVLALHDLSRDPGAGDWTSFVKRCNENSVNRCLHHHVFNLENSIELVKTAGFTITQAIKLYPFHLVVVAKT